MSEPQAVEKLDDELADFAAFPSNVTAETRVAQLQQLLTSLYVAGLTQGAATATRAQWDELSDIVLAAGEGREFQPMPLTWPEQR